MKIFMLSRTHYFIVAMIMVLFTGCGSKDKKDAQQQGVNNASMKQPPLPVEVFLIKAQTISDHIEVPGSILPNESTQIYPEISGRVIVLNVKEGTFVNKGDLLVKLYDEDLQAQLKKLQVQLEIAKQNEERSGQLLKIQGISKQDYDASLLTVNNIKADMDIIRTSISKTEIHAPFSGKLGLRNISPGAYITPLTVITTISQVSELKLQLNVPEKYGSEIKNGLDIQFTVDGSSKTYHAAVIATEVAIQEDTRSLMVRALVKAQDKFLIPGAFAKVQIVLGKNENALMIPSGSVVPQGRTKQIFLYKAGKAVTSDITTGVRDSSNVQVLTGLSPGDTLITTGLLFLRSGSDVKISKIN
ncbi:MAG: efflux RND transporter periplasmic adaptor subunit [Chitinophagales bacterium]